MHRAPPTLYATPCAQHFLWESALHCALSLSQELVAADPREAAPAHFGRLDLRDGGADARAGSALLGEDFHDGTLDGVCLLRRIDARVQPLLRIVIHHRRGLVVEGAEALAQRALVVVGADHERLARVVVAHRHERLPELRVVTPAARRVDQPASDALDKQLVVNLHLDDVVELHALVRQHPVELLRLLHRARKTIEDEAVLAVGPVDRLADDAHHNLVGDEPARLHHLVGRLTHLGPRRDGRAEHVARRQVAEAEALLDDRALRALARARRADQDHALLRRIGQTPVKLREDRGRRHVVERR
mmetsp:Transcript_5832/g.15227  ORF Transcript_5832/g.15227 Transcript_5832/m.15227 type:complete len:303 (+) Transcript_5832:72-980(+)